MLHTVGTVNMDKFDHIFAHSTLTFVHALRTSLNIGSQKCETNNRGTKFWSRLFKSKQKCCKNPKTIHYKAFVKKCIQLVLRGKRMTFWVLIFH